MKKSKRGISGIVVSLLEAAVGILLLLKPIGFTTGIIVACGILLMVWGVVSLIKYFRAEPEDAAVSQKLAKGLVELAAGAFCTFNSHWFITVFPVLTLLYGVAIMVTGLTKIQWTADMLRMKRKGWGIAAISAVCAVVCGVIIVTSPFSSTVVLWTFTGISLIVEAILDLLGIIFSNREMKTEASDEQEE